MVIIISGRYIKEMRNKLGISQTELARSVGVTQAHIAKIESEKVDARLSTINKVLAVLESSQSKMKCKLLMSDKVISVAPNDKVKKAVQIMRRHSIDQLPVIEKDRIVGSIMDYTIVKNMEKDISEKQVKEIMEEPFPVISPEDSIEVAKSLLNFHQAVLIADRGRMSGIITKSDLLGYG